MDIISYWDSSKWNEAEWTQYSATWDHGVWDDCLWNTSLLANFRTTLRNMEKVNIGSYCFEAGCVEPGCDNVDVPLRRILDNLEK